MDISLGGPLTKKYAWELNCGGRVGVFGDTSRYFSCCDVDLRYRKDEDHSPSFYVFLVLFGIRIIDGGVYNMYHAPCPICKKTETECMNANLCEEALEQYYKKKGL